MIRGTQICMLFCLLLVLIAAPACVGQGYTPQPFSADLALTTANGDKITGKYYLSLPSMRMDMTAKGHNVSSIMDGTTTYVVMHDQHIYMEMPANRPNPIMGQAPKIATNYDPNNPCASQLGVTCKKLGTETVNGRVCDKWQNTSEKGTSTMWMDQKLHFPIKSISSDGTDLEFTNVKEGKPDASLFQPPAGYRKMDLGGLGGRPPQ